ncbi:MAG: hemerythrin domain-containing protein [Notoacmeibacter sp.]|nr:hemerythrin domain-containing protein [Notoacmeibacter sp.]MCC0032883.1 hemerythrin domain-containing protein [Brucellaceae bacterium]
MNDFPASQKSVIPGGFSTRYEGDPITGMRKAHKDQLELCDTLEQIADSLPENVDRQLCLHAARALWPLVRGVHSYEENAVFPRLERILANADGITHTIARLKHEHAQDECYAEELTDTLLRLGAGDKGLNHETVGYMLRGFFEATRRHVAFEQEHLVMLARNSGAFPAPAVTK